MRRLCILCLFLWAGDLKASRRLKDLVHIEGVRTNALIGYGLVVGLSGTGDSSNALVSRQSTARMLQQLGVVVRPQDVVSGAYAAVIVTAELPAFARSGESLAVRISTIGDATHIGGGTLLMTPLKAGDGQIYAMAQGPLLAAVGVKKGINVVDLAEGALVEREWRPKFHNTKALHLGLHQADFTTAQRIVELLNSEFRGPFAKARDRSRIEVDLPLQYQSDTGVVAFIAHLEALEVVPDTRPVVLVQERTGTVVMGGSVHIKPITLAHKHWSFSVENKDAAGLPVAAFVKSLQELGAQPVDLIAILKAIDRAGALEGQLRLE